MTTENTTAAQVPAKLLEIGEWFEAGYKPVLDFHGWRVAVLRHSEAQDPANFKRVERHRETNEVFILTAGQADLIVLDGDATPGKPFVFPMELNVAYNIQQGVWHHVVQSEDGHIILIERTDTSRQNSDYVELPAAVIEEIKAGFTLK